MNRFTVTVWIEQEYIVNVEAEDEAEAEKKVRDMSVFDVTLFGSRTSDNPVHNALTVVGVKEKRDKRT